MSSKLGSVLTPTERTTYLVGQLAQSWAQLEILIDALTIITFVAFDGKQLQNEAPRALSRKLKFLRLMFSRRIALTQVRPAALHIFNAIKACSTLRHDCIHGSVSADTVEKTFSVRTTAYSPEMFHLRDRAVTHDEVLDASREALMLARLTGAIVMYVNDLLLSGDTSETLRRLLRVTDRTPSPRETEREFAKLLREAPPFPSS